MDCIYTAIFFIDRKSLQEGKINPQILVFFYFLNLTWEFLFFFFNNSVIEINYTFFIWKIFCTIEER